jgi:hypothetical protein
VSRGRYDRVVQDLAAERRPSFGAIVALLFGVAGLAFCIALLFLGMRAVLDIGGACASGGAVVTRQPCPDGVPLAVVGSIFGLFLFGTIAAIGGASVGGPYTGLVFAAWPALFLALAWNFLEYGIRPPGSDGGVDAAWLLCGIVFVIIGIGPLLAMLPERHAHLGPRADPLAMRRLLADLSARQRQMTDDDARASSWHGYTVPRPVGSAVPPADLTTRLERLSTLHTSGSLTDQEFDDAKRAVIAEVAAGR